MTAPLQPREITYRRVGAIALPVVLSNATVPIQGAIDTAIIGNLGEAAFLAAVGLGAAAIALLFGAFNFLQIGASGLTAQALGAGRRDRVMNTLVRTLVVAGLAAALILAVKAPLRDLALAIFEGSADAEALAGTYLDIRLWAAPAELGVYGLIGWFAGQEATRRLFEMQLVISTCNVLFNLVFVFGFGMDVDGVALGTVCGAWIGLGYGLWRAAGIRRRLLPEGWRIEWPRILERAELLRVARLNRDIFIRTILLTGSFAWMARLGSTQGDVVLAANGVLLQFLFIASHALDGFAMSAETLVGQATGAGSRRHLRRAVTVSTLAALAMAAAFSALATALGEPLIRLFTNVPEVRAAAGEYMLWATLAPLAGVLAFQFDGIFVGATEGARMRNAMIVSAGIYFPASWLMTAEFGNHGVWAAVHGLFLLRAGTLALAYPAIEARLGDAAGSAARGAL